jgi:hypothetical protein
MKKIDWHLAWLIMGFVIISLIYIFKPGSEAAFITLTEIITIAAPFIAVAIGAFFIKSYGARSLQGKAVLFLTLGFLCWGLADIYWTFTGQATVSLADVFYFAGYLLLLVGIFQGIRISDPGIFKNPKKLSILLLSLVILISTYLYFYPLSWDYEIGFLENLTTAGYIVVDLLLMTSVVFIIFSLFSGAISAGWIFIGLGVLSTLIADLWYATNYEAYYAGHIIDLLWFLGYFLFAYALVHFGRANAKAQELVKQQINSISNISKAKIKKG